MKSSIFLLTFVFTLVFYSCEKEKNTLDLTNASFSYTKINNDFPMKVKFNNLSKNKSEVYYWEFDMFGTSTEKDPEFIFEMTGIFQITLIAKGSAKSDTFSLEIELGENFNTNPTANFDIEFIGNMAPCMVEFKNKSTDATAYDWDFGDNNKSNEKDPKNIFLEPGTYPITLNAIKKVYVNGVVNELKSSVTKEITIENKPRFFSVDSVGLKLPFPNLDPYGNPWSFPPQYVKIVLYKESNTPDEWLPLDVNTYNLTKIPQVNDPKFFTNFKLNYDKESRYLIIFNIAELRNDPIELYGVIVDHKGVSPINGMKYQKKSVSNNELILDIDWVK